MELTDGAGAGYGVELGSMATGGMTSSTTVTTTTQQYGLDLGTGAETTTSGLIVDGGVTSSGMVMGVGESTTTGEDGLVMGVGDTGVVEGADAGGFAFSSQVGGFEGATSTTTTTQQYQYSSGVEEVNSGLEMEGATTGLQFGTVSSGFEMGSTGDAGNGEGITMGFNASGDMAGAANYSADANAPVDLGTLETSTSQYGTTGTTTTTTTTTVQHFTTSSDPLIGSTNVLEPIVAGSTETTDLDQIQQDP